MASPQVVGGDPSPSVIPAVVVRDNEQGTGYWTDWSVREMSFSFPVRYLNSQLAG